MSRTRHWADLRSRFFETYKSDEADIGKGPGIPRLVKQEWGWRRTLPGQQSQWGIPGTQLLVAVATGWWRTAGHLRGSDIIRKVVCRMKSYQQLAGSVQSCRTLCDSTDCSMPGLPVHHQLLKLAQTHVHWIGDAIQPSVIPFSSCL